MLPCCFYDFHCKFSKNDTRIGQYNTYLNYIEQVSTKCGFKVCIECLVQNNYFSATPYTDIYCEYASFNWARERSNSSPSRFCLSISESTFSDISFSSASAFLHYSKVSWFREAVWVNIPYNREKVFPHHISVLPELCGNNLTTLLNILPANTIPASANTLPLSFTPRDPVPSPATAIASWAAWPSSMWCCTSMVAVKKRNAMHPFPPPGATTLFVELWRGATSPRSPIF